MAVNLNFNETSIKKVNQQKPEVKNKTSVFKRIFKKKSKNLPVRTPITTNLSETPQTLNKPTLKIKKKRSKKKIALSILAFIFVMILVVFGVLYYKADQVLRTTGLNVSPLDTILFILGKRTGTTGGDNGSGGTEVKKPELKRDETGKYTNVMIVGVDSRQDRGSANTDTILVASYNYDKNIVSMYSIPRDLVVADNNGNGNIRINSVYIYAELQRKDSGMAALQEKVEEILNLKVQYYMMIDFAGFAKVVDTLGGVTVNVENSFTDCEYPWEGAPKNTALMGTVCYSQWAYSSSGSLATYEPIQYQQGLQTMDGTTALKYARSRHSMDNMEGSDFARARRQQRVIQAVKDKILSSETLSNPQKIIDIIGAVQDNVRFSGYTIQDIEAGLDILSKAKDAPVYTFVLDPSIGGFSILTENGVFSYGYGIMPIKGFDDYSDLHSYVNATRENPGLYTENPNIRLFDAGIGYQAGYDKTMQMIDSYPYVNFYYVGTVKYPTEGNVVYKVDPSASVPSLETVAKIFDAKIIDKPAGVNVNTYNVNIVVLLGTPPAPTPTPTETAEEATN